MSAILNMIKLKFVIVFPYVVCGQKIKKTTPVWRFSRSTSRVVVSGDSGNITKSITTCEIDLIKLQTCVVFFIFWPHTTVNIISIFGYSNTHHQELPYFTTRPERGVALNTRYWPTNCGVLACLKWLNRDTKLTGFALNCQKHQHWI